MKLLTFHRNDQVVLGVSTDHGVLDVALAARDTGSGFGTVTPAGFFKKGLAALEELEYLLEAALEAGTPLLDEPALVLGPCVPEPHKIVCVGLNYLRHAREAGQEPPSHPILFAKFHNTLTASKAHVRIPECTQQVDYEAELAVVIGRRTRDVSRGNALEHVLGYCNGNDLSARDLQLRTSQWLTGKSLDGFLPLGPYMLTAGDAGDPNRMPIRLWLNGELRQDSNTSDMIFDVPTLVSEISKVMTLESGDLILTGTPEGVVSGRTDKVWLRAGDQVDVEIGPLGRLTTYMAGSAS